MLKSKDFHPFKTYKSLVVKLFNSVNYFLFFLLVIVDFCSWQTENSINYWNWFPESNPIGIIPSGIYDVFGIKCWAAFQWMAMNIGFIFQSGKKTAYFRKFRIRCSSDGCGHVGPWVYWRRCSESDSCYHRLT